MSFSLLHSNLNTHTHDQHAHLILEFSGFIILIPECYTVHGAFKCVLTGRGTLLGKCMLAFILIKCPAIPLNRV
jgi:hypothetical protein